MNLVFVNCSNFLSNGAIQMFHLANELVARGHECLCVVPSGKDSVHGCGEARFGVAEFSEVRGQRLTFRDGRGPDLIHAWTPREGVRKVVLDLASRHRCPYFVHLEDNEDWVTAKLTDLPLEQLLEQPDEVLDPRVGDTWSHPRRFRDFLANAYGVSALIDRLVEFAPDDIESQVIWPGYSEHLFKPQPPDLTLRRAFGLSGDCFVVTYNGNAHPANADEMRSLYLAIGLLNRIGRQVKLIRLGVDAIDFLGDVRPWIEPHVIMVGSRPHSEQPRYLALADALIQPGSCGPFNDFRFPSKLPEFLAMAKPVILPATNIGRFLSHGENCLLLREGHCREIAEHLDTLIASPELRRRLADAGYQFCQEHLQWARAAEHLESLYTRALHSERPKRRRAPTGPMRHVAKRYATFEAARLGYATVQDFCDSVEHLPQLATINHDLKDSQRPWVFKAICGSVPFGSKLLEIGGGDPWVADLLSQIGYEVTIVDPYDGRDQGPTGFSTIREQYPHIRFVRGEFPAALGKDESYDCIYSISVLEHVPAENIAHLCEAVRTYSHGENPMTIHAIDHVHRGPGADEHLAKLKLLVAGLGFDRADLTTMLHRLDTDSETYFLSAESHNMWRGTMPYEEFPMRRCTSIQICVPVAATLGPRELTESPRSLEAPPTA